MKWFKIQLFAECPVTKERVKRGKGSLAVRKDEVSHIWSDDEGAALLIVAGETFEIVGMSFEHLLTELS